MNKKEESNPIEPSDSVEKIPAGLALSLLLLVAVGLCFHVYKKGEKAFKSTTVSEQKQIDIKVSGSGEEQLSKYKFVKSIWARDDDNAAGENKNKFLLWESIPVNSKVSEDNAKLSKNAEIIDVLSCDKEKKEDDWLPDKTNRINAWCSLIGTRSKMVDAKKKGEIIRQIVNQNDKIPVYEQVYDENGKPVYKKQVYDENGKPVYKNMVGNSKLFDLPPYDLWNGGIQEFPDDKISKDGSIISKNGEYTLSIYPSVQEGMFKFMSENNMIGVVFAYRPSNGDIYCMASAPGWTERENKEVPKRYRKIPGEKDLYEAAETYWDEFPKEGAHKQGNFSSYTPGSTMKPLTLLVYRDQKNDLNSLTIEVKEEDGDWKNRDSHYAKDVLEGDTIKAVHCAGKHTGIRNVTYGLGNSCNSFFAQLAEKLDFEKAKKTLEDMDFYVTVKSDEGRKHNRTIDNIQYLQSFFPFQKEMKKTRGNLENFIGEENLLVSPIDMAVWAALFGRLSLISDNDEDKKAKKNSKVYFPRIWLPADETKRNEGFQELLLTEDKPAENEHIAKLSKFVSTHKDAIADVGNIWRDAYSIYYDQKRMNVEKPFTAWSRWIDMAKTGTVEDRPDITHPKYKKCIKFKCLEENNGECLKFDKKCAESDDPPETRNQRTLSLYSEELDLAAYIVIENYGGSDGKKIHSPSNIKLAATSLKLTDLVAKALGKELVDPEKKNIQDTQLKILEERFEQKKSNVGQTPKKEILKKKGKGKVVKDKKKGTKSGTTKKVNGQNSPKPNKGKTKTPNKKAPQKSKSKKR